MYDVVCGMKLTKRPKFKSTHKRKSYHFCSKNCKAEFSKTPKKYVEGTPVIELNDISKSFHLGGVKIPVLHDLSLRVWEGDFIALVGVSGSGKSTAMNIMGLLDTPTKGKVYIDGKETSKIEEDQLAHIRNEKIGFVFQQFNLLGALNCRENVSLPLFFKKETKFLQQNGKVDKLISTVGLKERATHKPLEMSGGEQQRAAIARALVDDPEVVLADEPTGNLDSKTGKMVMEVFEKLNKEGRTIVVVTHDPSIAKGAKRILNLKDGKLISNHGLTKKVVWKNNHKSPKKAKK